MASSVSSAVSSQLTTAGSCTWLTVQQGPASKFGSVGFVGEDTGISSFFPFTQQVFIEHKRAKLCAKSIL